MKKFICVRGWKRNPTGEIIEEWQYNKLPDEVKSRNFKEHLEEESKPIVVETPKKVEEVPFKTEQKPTHQKFKPFTLEDLEVKNE